jgi:pimeloyl-ACP methyl ester carboxylesterase
MGTHVDVNGHSTWVHDRGGDGPALLLLHGGLSSTETSVGPLLALLEKNHRVVAFDRRGHGRTADGDAPFSYAAMAAETAAVVETLGLAPVRAVGYSDGGIILLYLALTRPELLESMVVVSANFRVDAVDPALIAGLEGAVNDPAGPFATAYAEVSPDGGDHWPEIARKALAMMTTEPQFTPEDLRPIATPTLVIASDDDLFPVSHSAAMYEALPNAQLAIVPGTSHLLTNEKPELIAGLVDDFLASPTPTPFMPVRRGGHPG